jgi:hypothetical protein
LWNMDDSKVEIIENRLILNGIKAIKFHYSKLK